jgi:hypothetical protein
MTVQRREQMALDEDLAKMKGNGKTPEQKPNSFEFPVEKVVAAEILYRKAREHYRPPSHWHEIETADLLKDLDAFEPYQELVLELSNIIPIVKKNIEIMANTCKDLVKPELLEHSNAHMPESLCRSIGEEIEMRFGKFAEHAAAMPEYHVKPCESLTRANQVNYTINELLNETRIIQGVILCRLLDKQLSALLFAYSGGHIWQESKYYSELEKEFECLRELKEQAQTRAYIHYRFSKDGIIITDDQNAT